MAITQSNLNNLNDTTAVMITKKAIGQLIYNIQNADNALETTIANNIIGTSDDQIIDSTSANYNFSLNGIKNYIDNLEAGPFGNTSDGSQYIASIKQINGKIEATTASAEITYDNNNKNSALPTSNSAITAAINTLNSTITESNASSNNVYITSLSQTNGKITATTATLSPVLSTIAATDTVTQQLAVKIGGVSSSAITLNTASINSYGVTKLSSSINSTAEDIAATPKAVKTAYDLANNMDLSEFILYKSNWSQKQEWYYNKEKSFFAASDINYQYPTDVTALDAFPNEMVIKTNVISQNDYDNESYDFNRTGKRLVQKIDKDGQSTFDSTASYIDEDGQPLSGLTEEQFLNPNTKVYLASAYNSDGYSYYVNWTLMEKNSTLSNEYSLSYSSTPAINNTKPTTLQDNNWYLCPSDEENSFQEDDILIISPKTDDDWILWREYGIRGCEIETEENNIKIEFKADTKPTSNTTAKLIKFILLDQNN